MRREAELFGPEPGFRAGAVIRGLAVACGLTFAIAAIFALLVLWGGLGEGVAELGAYYAGILCLAAGAAAGARAARSAGWLHGAAVGLAYVALASIVSVLALGTDLGLGPLVLHAGLGLAAGALAGILGVNL